MKYLVGLAVLIVLLQYPISKQEVGGLRPIQVLVASTENEQVILDGGDGMIGRGDNWYLAMENLEQIASGTPFFGTTFAVVLGDGNLVEPLLQESRIRPAASVYYGSGNPMDLANYLVGKNSTVTVQFLKSKEIAGGFVSIPTIQKVQGGYQVGR